MTPLSDALTAAQRRALQALEKALVAGAIEPEAAVELLRACGISDPVDTGYLFACLSTIKEWGAPVPAEPNGKPEEEEKASAKQLDYIGELLRKRGTVPSEKPDLDGITKARASELIDALTGGTFDPAKWRYPF